MLYCLLAIQRAVCIVTVSLILRWIDHFHSISATSPLVKSTVGGSIVIKRQLWEVIGHDQRIRALTAN